MDSLYFLLITTKASIAAIDNINQSHEKAWTQIKCIGVFIHYPFIGVYFQFYRVIVVLIQNVLFLRIAIECQD